MASYNDNEYISYPFIPDFDRTGFSIPTTNLDAYDLDYRTTSVNTVLNELLGRTGQGLCSSYPYSETVTITDDVLLHLSVVKYVDGYSNLYLQSMNVYDNYILFTFSCEGDNRYLFNFTVPKVFNDNYETNVAISSHNSMELAATAVFGQGVRNFTTNGVYVFSNAQIEPACLKLKAGHTVSSFVSYTGEKATGDVTVIEGYNFRASVTKGTLTLSAEVGAGAGTACEQFYVNTQNCDEYIYSINGLTPTWHGDYVIKAGPGVTVTGVPAENKIIIKSNIEACP